MGKIVIIEDILATRKVLTDILLDEGHRIAGAFKDIDEALECIKYEKPDIVLLDYRLKAWKDGYEVTGIDVLKEIMAINRKIKVIFITAFASKKIIKEAMLFGAVDFMVKPFRSEDLISRIEVSTGIQHNSIIADTVSSFTA
jgi:DNA-binding NtrC family response regulator